MVSLTSTSSTDSLRVTLWAVSSRYAGGDIFGYKLMTGLPNFTGAGARSSGQLNNFSSVDNIRSIGVGINPPAGSYCIVMTLDEFDSQNCRTADKFCTVDWAQFANPVQF